MTDVAASIARHREVRADGAHLLSRFLNRQVEVEGARLLAFTSVPPTG